MENTKNYIHKPFLEKRFFASMLDYALVFIITWLYIYSFGEPNEEGGMSVHNLMTLPIFGFWFIYFIGFELYLGSSLFHSIFRLRVVSVDGSPITFSQSFKRHLVDPIDFFFFGLTAIITIKNSEKYQRVGDMWAKTIVVKVSKQDS